MILLTTPTSFKADVIVMICGELSFSLVGELSSCLVCVGLNSEAPIGVFIPLDTSCNYNSHTHTYYSKEKSTIKQKYKYRNIFISSSMNSFIFFPNITDFHFYN